jgi:hypothetical protein
MKFWKLTPRHDTLWWCVDGVAPWLDANYSTCEELREDGGAEVVLVNFRH